MQYKSHENLFVWHPMQKNFAQQRALDGIGLKLHLYGGERVSKAGLLYTPYAMGGKKMLKDASQGYPVVAGMHLTTENLAQFEEIKKKISEFVSYPQSIQVIQTGEDISSSSVRILDWLSKVKLSHLRDKSIRLATRLLSHRGTQDELQQEYIEKLTQLQPMRLAQRMQYYQPYNAHLMQLQSIVVGYYAEKSLSLSSVEGLSLFKSGDVVEVTDSRRQRRNNFRVLLNSNNTFESALQNLYSVCLNNSSMLTRTNEVPFVNLTLLVLRQRLRKDRRTVRGPGIFYRTIRKTGRLFLSIPVSRVLLPLTEVNLKSNVLTNKKGYLQQICVNGVSCIRKEHHMESRILRAFPYLFGDSQSKLS